MAPRKTTTTKSATKARRTVKPARKEAPVAVPTRPAKSAFRMGTWVTLILFLAIAGAAFYLNQNPLPTDAEEGTATPVKEPVAVFDSGKTAMSIEVRPAEGNRVKIQRDANKVWSVTQPTTGAADQGLAEAAESQLLALTFGDEITGNAADYGLDVPAFTVNVTFNDGSREILEVGDLTPSNSGFYARLNNKMYIVSNGIEALTNLASAPPFAATPAPEVTPTP